MVQQDVVVRNQDITALPDEQLFKRDMEAINRFQKIVQETMNEGQDFGVIPGTNKPTLLKPGAEKITKILGLSDQYIILDKQEDWSKPFFRYLVKCTLINLKFNVVISEGMGECNSMESKYRYRDAQRKCPICEKETIFKSKLDGGGWFCWAKKGGCGAQFTAEDPEIINQDSGKVENEDIYSLVNTILKMAEKRALVDAALHAGRLSNVFTQDIEDLPEGTIKSKPAATSKRVEKSSEQSEEKSDLPASKHCDIHNVDMPLRHSKKDGNKPYYGHIIEGTTDKWCFGEEKKT